MRAWENNIRRMVPYVAGEQPDFPDMIKLNTNENPYPPSDQVQQLLNKETIERLRLYPDAKSTALTEELADFYHLKPEQVFTGVGSDDVLAMCFLTFFNSSRPILFPDITYSFYDVWAKLYHIPYEQPALDDRFRIRKEDYYKDNGGIVLANPNAPTSICEDLSVIEDIIDHNQDVIVIIDEAYIDFGGKSAVSLLDRYENLVVVQTFSKSRSLAGLRIGYAMAAPALIQALDVIKNSYNSYTMNTLSLLLGTQAVKDKEYFYAITKKIVETRERVKQQLSELGFVFPDSGTNFLFITHPEIEATKLFAYLREKHIFVRYFNKPRISNYLRVTIGTDYEMDQFLVAVKKYLNK